MGMIFLCVLPSHGISDLKVSELPEVFNRGYTLLKATRSTFSRERSRKSKNIQKKYWNWLLAILAFFNHFRKKRFTICAQQGLNTSISPCFAQQINGLVSI